MDVQIVIMAGGVGSRLWPASTSDNPKQFIDLLGTGRSLIQQTADRCLPLCGIENFWVVTSERYVDIVKSQLPGIPSDQILAEPQARNTAPCIAYAAWKISMKHPDAVMAVMPSDALIQDVDVFVSSLNKAIAFAGGGDISPEEPGEGGAIVTVGIKPQYPETGYGYIHAPGAVVDSVCKVAAFKEKPDVATARQYFDDGNYFWNAGIFVWSVRTAIAQIRAHVPGIATIMDELVPSLYTAFEQIELARLFPQCEKISIDYAVMEKAEHIYVVPCDPKWSDLGSWGAVKDKMDKDADGNAIVGADVRVLDSHDCLIYSDGPGIVAVEGLEGYVVVRSGDNLMICRKDDTQRVKEFIEKWQ